MDLYKENMKGSTLRNPCRLAKWSAPQESQKEQKKMWICLPSVDSVFKLTVKNALQVSSHPVMTGAMQSVT